jgi:NAD kinase
MRTAQIPNDVRESLEGAQSGRGNSRPGARRRIVVVVRQSRLDVLLKRHNTVNMARYQVERLGDDFDSYLLENLRNTVARESVMEELEDFDGIVTLERSQLPDFVFQPEDVVVVLGQDGLVANTLKYLDGQPVVGVNPDPARWDGLLLPFAPSDLDKVLPEVLADRRRFKDVTMAQATLNDGQTLLAVNDFFIGPKSHTSALYRISVGDRQEEQSSSGVIVSTGLGSTGWMRSVVAGAIGMAGSLSSNGAKVAEPTGLSWNADRLRFAVREPFPTRVTGASLVYGEFGRNNPLHVLSHMPAGGVVFSDGMEDDFLSFPSGVEAVITIAERKGRLVV